ncbi:hypothetical protein, partial [Ferrimicrobium sp.]|uniref:hypothetical protein n=1 Tax=Ferrimicrobium sp. TaxID=2926050 RepID=UPI002611D92F
IRQGLIGVTSSPPPLRTELPRLLTQLRDIHLSRLLLVRGPISRGVLLEAGRGSGDAPVSPAARVAPSSTWSWRRAAGSALGRGRQRARAVGRKVALGSSSVGD